ncbi:hypothetical protein ABPG72_013809 [Tetrahymena utriculariae]
MHIQEISPEQINEYIITKKIDISLERITKGQEYLKQFDIYIQKILGNGQFGIVFQGYDQQNKRSIAIKLIFGQNESFVQEYINEAQLARQINSKFVVKMYDQFYDQENKNYFIVYEYCEEGNLQNYYKKLNQQQIIEISIHLTQGILDIHAKQIIHSDIKPENILLTKVNGQLIAKIGDLGLSKKLQNNLTHISTYQGTYSFMAYEQTDGKLCIESDYFALGSVICFISGINLQDFMTMSLLKTGYYQDDQRNPLVSLALELMKKEPHDRMKLNIFLSKLLNMRIDQDLQQNNQNSKGNQFKYIKKNIFKFSIIVLLTLIIIKVGIEIQKNSNNNENYEIIFYNNGSSYKGQLKNNQKHGKGKIDFGNGIIYEGDFKKDTFYGYGQLIQINGDQYKGDFKDNFFDGKGFIKYTNGSSYEGEFKNGAYNGYGEFKQNNGNIKKGKWKDGEMI